MKLYMPTKVYNEKGCVRQHSQELAELEQAVEVLCTCLKLAALEKLGV